MKNPNRRKFLVWLVPSVFVVLYFSRPDWGGIDRCARVVEMPEVKQLDLTHKKLLKWDFFESPKFRFQIPPKSASDLTLMLEENGYSEWKEGFLQFGSFYLGDGPEDDLIYCSKRMRGFTVYWGYSKRQNKLYSIAFRH